MTKNNHRNNTKQKRTDSVCETPTNLTPSAAHYVIVKDNVIEFTSSLFQKYNVDIVGVGLEATRTGKVDPYLTMSVFISADSEDLLGGGQSFANSMLRDRIKTSGMSVSENLGKALRAVGKQNAQVQRTNRPNLYHVELEPLTIISLMLGVNPSIHECAVTEVVSRKSTVLISAIKSRARSGRRRRNNNNGDLMSTIK